MAQSVVGMQATVSAEQVEEYRAVFNFYSKGTLMVPSSEIGNVR